VREIFIPGNVPSLKNSKIKTSRGIFPSKTVTKYLRSLNIQYFSSSKKVVKGYVAKEKENLFKKVFEEAGWEKPDCQVVIGFHPVRGTKHKFDFGNCCQIIQDLMVAHDFLEDDDMDHLVPIPYEKEGQYYSYDKENPGMYIRLYEPK
jgi:hypothetical protein